MYSDLRYRGNKNPYYLTYVLITEQIIHYTEIHFTKVKIKLIYINILPFSSVDRLVYCSSAKSVFDDISNIFVVYRSVFLTI